MMKQFKSALAALGLVAIIALPFLGWGKALTLAICAGIYHWFTIHALHRKKPSPSASSIPSPLRRFRTLLDPVFSLASRYPWLILFPALLLPLLLNRYQVEVVTLALIYAALAIGLNFIVGLSGLLALGYIAFYAIGAYTYALLNTHFHVNFFLALPLGLATGALAGVLVGLPVLRLRGDYLAIVTLGFGEIVRIILNNWDSVTAGPNGIMNIARPTLAGLKVGTPFGYYLLALCLVGLTIFVQSRLVHSRIGRAWEAVREDELAAAHSGVPVVKMKLLAMMLGGAFAGAAGTLFASRLTHVSPESFTFMESILVLCMVVIGGMGSVPGVVIGAVGLILVPELLRGAALYRMLAFGLLMVFMMHYRREGIIPSRRLKQAGV
jgi:branched-chain amino acid transport system permease protein